MQIVDSDKAGERFALGMVGGLGTGDLAALRRLIQQIREYMRAVDHVNVAAADVINSTVADRDKVEKTVVQHGGHQSGSYAFLQSQIECSGDHMLIGFTGGAFERGRNGLGGELLGICVKNGTHRSL